MTEFLAAIVQLKTLDTPTRNLLADQFEKEGLPVILPKETNVWHYFINPLGFIVSAFKNYQKTPNILQEVFNGKHIGMEIIEMSAYSSDL